MHYSYAINLSITNTNNAKSSKRQPNQLPMQDAKLYNTHKKKKNETKQKPKEED